MEMVDAVPMDMFKDLWSLAESLLPQIPSIEMWAMKDIKGTALWNIEMKAALRDISIEAKKRNVEVKADKAMKLEAANKDLNVKAGKTNIVVTAKKKVDVKAEEDNLDDRGRQEEGVHQVAGPDFPEMRRSQHLDGQVRQHRDQRQEHQHQGDGQAAGAGQADQSELRTPAMNQPESGAPR